MTILTPIRSVTITTVTIASTMDRGRLDRNQQPLKILKSAPQPPSKAAAAALASTRRGTETDLAQCSGDIISNEPASACAQSSAPSSGAAAAIVIDPFCGQGTVLAVANELEMDALGVELSRKRCRQALQLRVLQAKDAPAFSP